MTGHTIELIEQEEQACEDFKQGDFIFIKDGDGTCWIAGTYEDWTDEIYANFSALAATQFMCFTSGVLMDADEFEAFIRGWDYEVVRDPVHITVMRKGKNAQFK